MSSKGSETPLYRKPSYSAPKIRSSIRLSSGFESSSQIAFQQMMLAYRGYAPDFLETYTDNIGKVTAADVQAVAQKYLHPDALTIVTVGNKANFDRPLDEFGEVTEIEIEQPAPPPAEPMPEASEGDMAKAKEIPRTGSRGVWWT